MKKLILTTVVSLLLIANCGEVGSEKKKPSSSSDKKYEKMRKVGNDMAKAMASDLNQNDKSRREVFTKISNKFDGDYNMLYEHINDSSRKVINNKYNKLAKEKNNKVFVDEDDSEDGTEDDFESEDDIIEPDDEATVDETILATDVSQIIPGLQVRMPFITEWTDNGIMEAGGLIVASYPFGVNDQDVGDIVGYDGNGNTVIINEDNADAIPYILIDQNERIDLKTGLLRSGYSGEEMSKKSTKSKNGNLNYKLSTTGVDPKSYKIGTGDWKDLRLSDLGKDKHIITTEQVDADLGPEDDMDDMENNPGRISKRHSGSKRGYNYTKFRIYRFKCENVRRYESWWTGGEPEFELYLEQFGGDNEIYVYGHPVNESSQYEGHRIQYAGYYDWSGHNYRTSYRYISTPTTRWSDSIPTSLSDMFVIRVMEYDVTSADDYAGRERFYSKNKFWRHERLSKGDVVLRIKTW